MFFAVKDAFQKVIAAPRSNSKAATKVVDDFSVEKRKMTWPENCALALPPYLCSYGINGYGVFSVNFRRFGVSVFFCVVCVDAHLQIFREEKSKIYLGEK